MIASSLFPAPVDQSWFCRDKRSRMMWCNKPFVKVTIDRTGIGSEQFLSTSPLIFKNYLFNVEKENSKFLFFSKIVFMINVCRSGFCCFHIWIREKKIENGSECYLFIYVLKNGLYFNSDTRTKKRGNTAGIKLIHCNAATRLIALKLCHQYKSGRYMVVGCFSRIECLIF